jgi:hypothetical protein
MFLLRLYSIKSSEAHSCVSWLQVETNVSGTISVPIITTLMMGTGCRWLVSTCNQLTRLCAREDFIEFSRCESFKLYFVFILCSSYIFVTSFGGFLQVVVIYIAWYWFVIIFKLLSLFCDYGAWK